MSPVPPGLRRSQDYGGGAAWQGFCHPGQPLGCRDTALTQTLCSMSSQGQIGQGGVGPGHGLTLSAPPEPGRAQFPPAPVLWWRFPWPLLTPAWPIHLPAAMAATPPPAIEQQDEKV